MIPHRFCVENYAKEVDYPTVGALGNYVNSFLARDKLIWHPKPGPSPKPTPDHDPNQLSSSSQIQNIQGMGGIKLCIGTKFSVFIYCNLAWSASSLRVLSM